MSGRNTSMYLRKRPRLDVSNGNSSINSQPVFPSSDENSAFLCSISDISLNNSASSSISIVQVPSKVIGIKAVGKDVPKFKPITENSLYAKIIMKSKNIEKIVDVWMTLYNTSNESAIIVFIQLIIDMMGYQNFSLIDELKDWDFINIKQLIEDSPSTVQMECEFVLKNNSTYARGIAKTYYNFIYFVLQSAAQLNILFDAFFLEKIIDFLKVMSLSKVRVIKYTSVITAMKFCTELLSIWKTADCNREEEMYLTNKIRDCLFLYYKNISLPDSYLIMVRAACTSEIKKWLQTDLHLIVTKRLLKFLRGLLVEFKPELRIAALNVCKSLVVHLKTIYYEDQKSDVLKLLKLIQGRLVDVDKNVVDLSIQVITEFVVELNINLDTTTRNYIFKCIYARNRDLARSAGHFLYCLLSESTPEEFLKKIIQFDFYQSNLTLHLVDALIRIAREFQEFDFILEFLDDDSGEFTREEQMKLIEIFYYSAKFMVTGSISGINDNQINEENLQQFMKDFLPKVSNLILKCTNYEFTFLLKTIVLVDFSCCAISCSDIGNITKALLEILNSSDKEDDAELISDIFTNLTNEYCPWKNRNKDILLDYYNTIIENYTTFIITMADWSKMTNEKCKQLSKQLRLISILSKHCGVDDINWNYIYYDWNLLGYKDNIIKHQIVCCQRYLVCQFIKVKEFDDDKPILDERLSIFISSSTDVLRKSNNVELQIWIFNALYNLVKELKQIEHKKHFTIDSLAFSESTVNTLISMIHKICFMKQAGISRQVKRSLLIKTLNMFTLKCIDHIFIPLIYVHYFSENFEDIFQNIFECYKSDNKCSTMLCVFRHLLDINNIDMLAVIAAQISNIIDRKTSVYLFKMLYEYLQKDETNVSLLLYMRPFLKKISSASRKDLYSCMQRLLNSSLLGNRIIKEFGSLLQH